MHALLPIDTAARDFTPQPITDEEAAAMFRAAVNLFRLWRLTDEEAAVLLDLPVRTYRRWKADGAGRIDRERAVCPQGVPGSLVGGRADTTAGASWPHRPPPSVTVCPAT